MFLLFFCRRVVALRLLDIFLELTTRRANMNPDEAAAFRLMPDFDLMEAVLHNCLQYVWDDQNMPRLLVRSKFFRVNFGQVLCVCDIIVVN